ncbi:MAG TPA: FAD-dependent oxidoreductase [Jatrophihabitans sp.]|jgi:NADH dehydrogenase FAD-containing subunit|nr:FAD-dependent oxidoreductase [Jatrophihabitans sp.]
MTQHVVVVGGGYGGTLVAKELDSKADVTLIDPREGFVNAAACLRALTRPEWAHHAFFRYDSLLVRGKVVRDRAISVDPAGVTLLSGNGIDADYLVLATGSSYAYPAKPNDAAMTIAAQLADLRSTHDELASAERVLILGAGPVGIELAGEIKEVWSDKHVIIVDPGEKLLPGFLDEVRKELLRQLDGLGVELRLGTRLLTPPQLPPGRAGHFTVGANRGRPISADIWFKAYGVTANTDYLRNGQLTPLTRGLVPVTERLNVEGHDHVYAIGDIAALADPKMASYAMVHAQVVADNITAQLSGQAPDAIHSTAEDRRILLPLGATAGVGQLPTPNGPGAATVDTVIERKGRDLFTARFADRFGLPPA